MVKISVNRVKRALEANRDEKPTKRENITPARKEMPEKRENTLLSQLQGELQALYLKRNKISTGIYQAIKGETTPHSIEISEVLGHLNHTYDAQRMEQRLFGIEVLTAKGERQMVNIRKKVIDKGREERSGFKHSLKQHGNLMILNENGEPRTIKVCAIYGFRNHNSTKWQRVRH